MAEASPMDELIRDSYDVVIGLEIHVQLNTRSKIFSPDAVSFAQEPNTQAGEITLAYPGTLPKLNREVVNLALRMAVACRSSINRLQLFDRKNYFYPDLPKGYQLTQDRAPLCRGGHLAVPTRSGLLRIELEKIHMEEDAGKLLHRDGSDESLVDFNRAGVPLLEIVTRPVIHSATDAAAALTEVRKLVRFLGISDGNMEEGSLRCDANVSIRPKGTQPLGRKVEIKNLNSIRNLSHAIEYDVERQIGLSEAGLPVVSETRGYDAESGRTFPQRTKEELSDYRYFPDPDLVPLIVDSTWLDEIRAAMPTLPDEWFHRLTSEYGLSATDALTLTETPEGIQYFDELCREGVRYKAAANWMIGPVRSILNERGWSVAEFPLRPSRMAGIIGLVESEQVSFSAAAQRLLPAMVASPQEEPAGMANSLGLLKVRDEGMLESVVDEVIREFPLKVEEYHKGKKGIVAMFMGEVMKRTSGKADPVKANELITRKLDSR